MISNNISDTLKIRSVVCTKEGKGVEEAWFWEKHSSRRNFKCKSICYSKNCPLDLSDPWVGGGREWGGERRGMVGQKLSIKIS